jgi:single-strand DNA-binding protein
MNVHIIRGRLTRDPEMVGTSSSVAKFTVAVDDWDSAAKEKTAQFFDCVAFGKQAETARDYLSKGRDVMIRGKQRRRSYDSKKHEGEKVYVWELIVDEIELGPRPASDRDEDKPSSGSSLWS